MSEMRRLIDILNDKSVHLNESQQVNEITGFVGSIKGFLSGSKEREKTLRSWKEFLAKYGSDGDYDDLKQFIKANKFGISDSAINAIAKKVGVDKYTNTKVPHKDLMRFFGKVAQKVDTGQVGSVSDKSKEKKEPTIGSKKIDTKGQYSRGRKEPSIGKKKDDTSDSSKKSSKVGQGGIDTLRDKIAGNEDLTDMEKRYLNDLLSKL